jgi:hypothetical protein
MPHAQQMTQEMRECISHCLDCHASCLETSTHCLMMGGEHASPQHQKVLQDCAQACITSADFMLRLSPFHPQYCGICAELCRACGDSCEQMAQGDPVMRQCAEACRRCEQSCRRMAQHAMA